MSVFKVNLNQSGIPNPTDQSIINGNSIQRTVILTGPKGKKIRLKDGDTFTDCNYFKMYCYPAKSLESAILQVITDDGTIWDSQDDTNNVITKVVNLTISGGTTYEDNVLDIVETYGGPAIISQFTINGSDVKMKINNDDDAILDLATGFRIFDRGEITLRSIAFDNSISGSDDATLQILLTVKVESNS